MSVGSATMYAQQTAPAQQGTQPPLPIQPPTDASDEQQAAAEREESGDEIVSAEGVAIDSTVQDTAQPPPPVVRKKNNNPPSRPSLTPQELREASDRVSPEQQERLDYIRQQEAKEDSIKTIRFKKKLAILEKQISGEEFQNQPARYPRGYIPPDTTISEIYDPDFFQSIGDFLYDVFVSPPTTMDLVRTVRYISRPHQFRYRVGGSLERLQMPLLSNKPMRGIGIGGQVSYGYRTSNYLLDQTLIFDRSVYGSTAERDIDISYSLTSNTLGYQIDAYRLWFVSYRYYFESFVGLGVHFFARSFEKEAFDNTHYYYEAWMSFPLLIKNEMRFWDGFSVEHTLKVHLLSLRKPSLYHLNIPQEGFTSFEEREIPSALVRTIENYPSALFSQGEWLLPPQFSVVQSQVAISYQFTLSLKFSIEYSFGLTLIDDIKPVKWVTHGASVGVVNYW